MADDSDNGSGSKDRATVALVNAKIDTVLEKIEGNARTQEANMGALSDRLNTLAALPAQVSAQHELLTLLQARVLMSEQRLDKRDKDDDELDGKDHEFRRIHRPTLVLSALALFVSALTLAAILYVNLHA